MVTMSGTHSRVIGTYRHKEASVRERKAAIGSKLLLGALDEAHQWQGLHERKMNGTFVGPD